MRKIFHPFFALVCLSTSAIAAEIGMELLPRGRPFRMTFSDPREIRMALSFDASSKINAAVGNYFSLFSIKPKESGPDYWFVHFGLEGAGFFTMRHAESRFPLETADGLIGFYLEGARGPWALQLRYTHISAHLADGSLGPPIPYSRETAILRAGFSDSPERHVYAGVLALANSVPKLPALGFQVGGSFFLPLGTTKIVPFTATDLKWRQESNFNPAWNLQMGIALNNPPEAYRSFRFFYAYYTGADPRGQYFDRALTTHSFGIEMQI